MGYIIYGLMMIAFTIAMFLCITHEYYIYGTLYFIAVNAMSLTLGIDLCTKDRTESN